MRDKINPLAVRAARFAAILMIVAAASIVLASCYHVYAEWGNIRARIESSQYRAETLDYGRAKKIVDTSRAAVKKSPARAKPADDMWPYIG